MKKIFSILFLVALAFTESSGQSYSALGTTYGSFLKRFRPDSTLHIPTFSGVPSGIASLKSSQRDRGAFYYDSAGKKTYVFNPKDSTWTSFASESDYVPYENATRNVVIGNYRVSARTFLNDSILARTSAGAKILSNSGSVVAEWGLGGGDNIDFHGFAGMNYNRSGSMTSLSFTPKVYTDSLVALRLRISDTASMLSNYLRRTDSTGLFSAVVRTFGNQTVNGIKTFGSDLVVNSLTLGRGNGNNSSNAVFGSGVFNSNTTGTRNVAIGESALSSNTSGYDNTAIGWYAVDATNTGYGNTGIGSDALGNNSTGTYNIGIGVGAGQYITGLSPNSTGSNSIFLGYNSKAAANGETNQIVIGHNATGNGSNTVTFGNSSTTNNYFNGSLRTTQDLYFTGGNNNRIEFVSEDGIIYTNGGSYLTLGASGNASNLLFDRTNARWGIGTANPTVTFDVNGTVRATALRQSSLASSIVKADANGVLEAAVAGDITSLISGTYLPLSGGTLTGTLGMSGVDISSSSAVVLNASGRAANFQDLIRAINTSGDFLLTLEGSAAGARFTGSTAYASVLGTNTATDLQFGTNNIVRLTLNSSALTSTVPINGTSLSMSGGGSFGASGAAVVISNATDVWYRVLRGSSYTNIGVDATGVFYNTNTNHRFLVSDGAINALSIASTGAITASSSVTASSNIITNGEFRVDPSSGDGIVRMYTASTERAAIRANATKFFIEVGTFGERLSITESTGLLTYTGAATFSSSVTASSFVKSGGTSTQALIADGSVQTLTSGTYTPTITNTSNITSTTARTTTYTRVGNTVTVSGWVTITTVTNEGSTEIGISLPIASNFTAAYDLSGSGFYEVSDSYTAQFTVKPDTTNDRAKIVFVPIFGSGTGVETQFTFQYQVL